MLMINFHTLVYFQMFDARKSWHWEQVYKGQTEEQEEQEVQRKRQSFNPDVVSFLNKLADFQNYGICQNWNSIHIPTDFHLGG